MKVYVHQKGVIMVGKAWEIKHKLLEYQKQYPFLKNWINEADKKKEG